MVLCRCSCLVWTYFSYEFYWFEIQRVELCFCCEGANVKLLWIERNKSSNVRTEKFIAHFITTNEWCNSFSVMCFCSVYQYSAMEFELNSRYISIIIFSTSVLLEVLLYFYLLTFFFFKNIIVSDNKRRGKEVSIVEYRM